MKKLVLFVCALFFTTAMISTATANDAVSGDIAGQVIVPEGMKASDVQQAILEAAVGRGWTIKSKDDRTVTTFLENGRWVSNLTFVYDEKEITIYSRTTRKGKPAIPENWVDFLKQDINKILSTKAYLK